MTEEGELVGSMARDFSEEMLGREEEEDEVLPAGVVPGIGLGIVEVWLFVRVVSGEGLVSCCRLDCHVPGPPAGSSRLW
jgi:hypothetical protein